MKDSAGQKLAYVYFEEEPGRRSAAKTIGLSIAAPMLLLADELID